MLMFAERLKPGDEIRVIAPSMSMSILKEKQVEIAEERLRRLGFTVTYGKNAFIQNEFFSSSIGEKIADLHEAFSDPNVKGILTAIGGYNSNQLLKFIDYELIRNNPKVFCGFGDITALTAAIHKKTGLITYSGPHFSSFGMKHGFDYTFTSFLDAVTNDAPYEVSPSAEWSDDPWYFDQDKRNFIKQDSYLVLQEGEAEGKLIGGNLSTLNLLQGTEFMPSLQDAVLFLEDDEESHPQSFERALQSLLHMPDAGNVRALLIGRFQKDSHMTEEALRKIIFSKEELKGIPIIANVNIGHTSPMATIPLGAKATISAFGNDTEIMIWQKK